MHHSDQGGALRGLRQQLAYLDGSGGVQCGGGLIRQYQPGLLHQKAGHGHFLALAARELVRPGGCPRAQAHRVQRGLGLGLFCGGEMATPAAPAAHTAKAADQHIVQRTEPRHQVQPLQDLAHLPAQLAQFGGSQRGVQRVAQHLQSAMRGRHEAAQGPQQSRFARAVGPHNPDTFTRHYSQFGNLQEGAPTRSAHQRVHGNGGRVHSSAARMRRLIASNEATRITTTISTVDRRPH